MLNSCSQQEATKQSFRELWKHKHFLHQIRAVLIPFLTFTILSFLNGNMGTVDSGDNDAGYMHAIYPALIPDEHFSLNIIWLKAACIPYLSTKYSQ
jgi:hypothetical protein